MFKHYVLLKGKPVLPPARYLRDWEDKYAMPKAYAYILWHRYILEDEKPVICIKLDGAFVPIQMGRHLMKGVAFDGVSELKKS